MEIPRVGHLKMKISAQSYIIKKKYSIRNLKKIDSNSVTSLRIT